MGVSSSKWWEREDENPNTTRTESETKMFFDFYLETKEKQFIDSNIQYMF